MAAYSCSSFEYCRIVERAAARFKSQGRGAYYFCRGKLLHDPVFMALLQSGAFENDARITDVGCGTGLLAALLASSSGTARLGTFHGIDLRAGAIAIAHRALADRGDRIRFEVGDIRTAAVPESDVVVILDVLHYIDDAAQRSVLQRVHRALAPRGTLLLRVADAAGGWRLNATLATDWIVTFARNGRPPQFCCRPLAQWIALLEQTGFDVKARPMSNGTPFCNVLLTAVKHDAPF